MPLIIKEIRIDPGAEWRALGRFRFIHVQRNLSEVIHSRTEMKDVHLDHDAIARSWTKLQATAKAHGDFTVAYEDLLSNAGDLARRISSVVQLSPADLSVTTASVKRSARDTHTFMRHQKLSQPAFESAVASSDSVQDDKKAYQGNTLSHQQCGLARDQPLVYIHVMKS